MCEDLSTLFNPVAQCEICGKETAVTEQSIPGMEYANVGIGERCMDAGMTTPLWAFRAMTAMLYSTGREIAPEMAGRLTDHLNYLAPNDFDQRMRMLSDVWDQGQEQTKLIPQDPQAIVDGWSRKTRERLSDGPE